MFETVLFPSAPPVDFFVDPITGSDSYSGKAPNAAFKTVAPLIGVPLHRGVSFACGTRSKVSYSPVNSGSEGQPLLFTSHGTGAKPIVSSADTYFSASWTNVSDNIWSMPASSTWDGTLIWWDPTAGLATEGSVQALIKGTAGSLAANQWAISNGCLQVNIGRQPVATDVFEVPVNNNIFAINRDFVRLSDLKIMYGPGSLIEVASAKSVLGFHIDRCDLAYSDTAYLLHLGHGGAPTDFLVDDCDFHDQANNAGAFSAHADSAAGGGNGIVQNTRIRRIEGLSLTSHDTVALLHDHITIDGGKIAVVGGGKGTPSPHTFQFMTMVNQPPNGSPGDFYIQIYDGTGLAACDPATVINFYNCTIAAGNMPVQCRLIKDGSGTTEWRNVLTYGFWSAGFDGIKANGSRSTQACAGATFSNLNFFFNGSPPGDYTTLQGMGDVNLVADPFVDLAGGDLRLDPRNGAALIGAGIVIPGVTRSPRPNIGALPR